MTTPRLRHGVFILMLCAINGCANVGKSYSQIDPERAAADVRKSNGYASLKTVTPGAAKLVMRSEGSPGNVEFSTHTASDGCKDFKTFGSTRYSGQGVVYPWIAKMTSKASGLPGFLSKDLIPEQSIVIRGYGTSSGSNAAPGSRMTVTTSERCGPLFSKFTPVAGHAYLVRFNWENDSCEQNIFDATNPDAPVPVQSEAIASCEMP